MNKVGQRLNDRIIDMLKTVCPTTFLGRGGGGGGNKSMCIQNVPILSFASEYTKRETERERQRERETDRQREILSSFIYFSKSTRVSLLKCLKAPYSSKIDILLSKKGLINCYVLLIQS